jgi:hypothetical protein
MLQREINMISILPLRQNKLDTHFLLQPMRYWRELVYPRIFDKTPPAISTCWIANRKMLIKHGGFAGLKRSIRPERHIARGVSERGHYLFIRASAGLGISSTKSMSAQWSTAVRTRYPEYHNRPESVLFATAWHVLLILGPFVSLFIAINKDELILAAFSMLSVLYLLATHYLVYEMTTSQRSTRPFMFYIPSVLLEIIVINYSMWAYEFSEVIWKGRNICMPVLRSYKKLPEIQ